MKILSRIFLIFLISVAISIPCLAVTKVGTTAAQFLKIGVGARAIAMGGAFVAVANDVTGLYWNPAGIARMPRSEAILLHTEWLADVNFDYAGIAIKIGRLGTVGASITSVDMADMKVRTELQPEGTGEFFAAGDIAGSIAFARNLTDRFSIGFNAKYVHQRIWHMSTSGFAIDVGTLFTTQFKDMKIGMSISNFGTNMEMSGRDTREFIDINPDANGSNDKIPSHLQLDSWSLPLIFRVGVSIDPINTDKHRLTVALDALHPNDNRERLNIGAEYSLRNMVFLRGGLKSVQFTAPSGDSEFGIMEPVTDSEEGFTVGAGVHLPIGSFAKLKLDYAYADFGRLQDVQRFSLSIEF
jgi:opacity protein-like surface antigen